MGWLVLSAKVYFQKNKEHLKKLSANSFAVSLLRTGPKWRIFLTVCFKNKI